MIPILWTKKHNMDNYFIKYNKFKVHWNHKKKLNSTWKSQKLLKYDLSWVSLLCEFIIYACEFWSRNFKWEIPSWGLSNAIWHASIWNHFIIFLSFNVHESNLPIWLLFIFLGYNLTSRFPNGKFELFFLHLHLETFPII